MIRLARIILLIIMIQIIIQILENVMVENRKNGEAFTVRNLQAQIEDMKKKNDQLRIHILEETSIQTLSNKAKQMGFQEANNYIYVR